jgi:hypothetical protein
MLQDVGIKKVFYTSNKNGELICEHIKDMVSIQSSSVTRHLHFVNSRKETANNVYFEELLKNNFPKYIKKKSLMCFLNHNYLNIFPNNKIMIKGEVVSFNTVSGVLILEALII